MRKSYQYLVVVRHGRTLANVLTARPTSEHFYPVVGSDQALGLTDTGVFQAVTAGVRLSWLFPLRMPLKTIDCSTFLRTQTTAEIISHHLPYAVDIVCDGRISKRSYGDFWNITYAGVETLYPGEHALYAEQGEFLYRPPNGENYPDLLSRVNEYLEEKVNHATGNRCVVTHAAVCLAIEKAICKISDKELLARYNANKVDNGEITIYWRKTVDEPWKKCPEWWYRMRCLIADLPGWISTWTKAS
jgi:2,3-bisphosphoglycerate-dependent phosphoglycerate mutase